MLRITWNKEREREEETEEWMLLQTFLGLSNQEYSLGNLGIIRSFRPKT
jgi:hypothetical protein